MRRDSERRPAGPARVPILAYHFTGPPHDAEDALYTVATDAFDLQLRYLAESGYQSIGLHQLDEALSGNGAAARSVVITFDDGRGCVYREAFPVLKKYGMTATVFLISSRLDHGLFLSRDQITEMADQGISFESHSVNHKRLTSLPTADKKFELEHSRSVLERFLKREVAFLAYPFGDCNAEVQELARAAGYRAAVSGRTGLADASSDLFALPRIGIRRQDEMNRFVRKLDGQFNDKPGWSAGLVARLRGKASQLAQKFL